MNQPHRCTYVTRGWGVHDERWTAALRSSEFTVTDISLERDELSIEDVRQRLMDGTDPVLAGPLDITQGLIGIPAPLFGLSWGFDLVQAHDRHESLDWLTELSGLIVDSTNTYNIALDAGLDASRIHVIPWGVDLKTFTAEGSRADLTEFGVPVRHRVILSLRALEPLYRVEDIVLAFAQIASQFPDTHLVIGNDGSLRSQLEALVTSLQLENRVFFIGSLPEKSLPGLFRAADVYVTASEVDGTSVTLLQAMACGTPVVASENPGNRDWVSHETGLGFPIGSAEDLAQRLSQVLKAPLEAKGRTPRAMQIVRKSADWARNQTLLGDAVRGAGK